MSRAGRAAKSLNCEGKVSEWAICLDGKPAAWSRHGFSGGNSPWLFGANSWIASAGLNFCKGSGASIRPQEQEIAIVEVIILEISHDLRILSPLENSDLGVESVFVDNFRLLSVIS